MRHNISIPLIRLSILTVALWCGVLTTSAQTTAFSYQGQLNDGGSPATASYDMQFKLFDALNIGAQVGSTVTLTNVAVSSGIFTVTLDFGASAFPGANRWLEISVKLAGAGTYTTLTPRQALTSTPYAIKSLATATADGLSAACAGCVSSTQIGSLPTGSGNYIQNTTTLQSANFNISGNGFIGGNVGIGINPAQQVLHVDGANEILSTGSGSGFKFRNRASTSSADDWTWYSADNIARFNRVSFGDLLGITPDGKVGIGTITPKTSLHIPETGLQVGTSTTATDNFHLVSDLQGSLRGFRLYSGNYGFGTHLLTVLPNGNVGIGTTDPDEKLTVAGRIFSTSGGFLFPDSTLQTTANAIEATTKVTYPTSSIEIAPNDFVPSVTTIGEVTLNVPGYYLIMATANFYNGAILFGQDNSRECRCSLSEQTQAGSVPSPYEFTLNGNQDQVVNWHWVASSFTTNNIRITCKAISGGTDRSYVYASKVRLTAIKIGSLGLQ